MEKKKKYGGIILIAVILIVAVLIVLAMRRPKDEAEKELAEVQEKGIRAMYVTFGEDFNIFIDIDNNSPFTINFPKEILAKDGSEITKEQLKKGNVVEIYGNGVMLESYPGQYPQVTKIQVVEEGYPSDADQYQSIIDEIYHEPDPAEPPCLNGEYTTSEVSAAVMITRGTYEWTYADKDGNTQTALADSAHILEWQEINDVTLKAPVDMKLRFSQKPDKVTVLRWKSEERVTEPGGGSFPQGEEVTVKDEDGDWFIQAEAGYVYLVKAEWENGYAEYGFLTN